MTLEQMREWAAGLEKEIEQVLSRAERGLRRAEKALLVKVLEYLNDWDWAEKVLGSTARNFSRLNVLAAIFEQFAEDELDPLTRRFGADLLAIAGRNADYYLLAGFDEAKVKEVAADVRLIRAKLGLAEDGGLLRGGYLDLLAKTSEAKTALRDYVVQSMASGASQTEFAKGLKGLIEGNKDVDGGLVRYWKQYAYDAPNQVREIHNLHIANELTLNYFVYTGGLIKTSRTFCVKKNGKVFSRQEAELWRNDPDLIDQKTKAQYQPLVERGRNNCRHFLMWVSDQRAQQLKDAANA